MFKFFLIEIADLTKVQVENLVYRERRAMAGLKKASSRADEKLLSAASSNLSTLTTAELHDWCQKHAAVPDNPDQVFVVDYYIEEGEDVDDEPEAKWQIILTTKCLLGKLSSCAGLQCDATYKLLKRPDKGLLFMAGVTDLHHQFHGILWSLGSNEDTEAYIRLFKCLQNEGYEPEAILGDGSKAITKAAKAIFSDAKRLMCYFHLTQIIRRQWKPIRKSKKFKRFKDDVRVLQLSRSEEEFTIGAKLLVQKWGNKHYAKAFMKSFTKKYLKGNLSNWFEGASPFAATNN